MGSMPPNRDRRAALVLSGGIALLLVAALLVSSRRAESDRGGTSILCSFLPVYVFTLNVVGDTPGVKVDLLLSPNIGCPHDYAVSPPDLLRVAKADLVIINGLGAEPFAADLLADKSNGRVLSISDDVESLCAEQHDEGEHGHEHAAHDHGAVNPHAWASPVQAARQVRTLTRKLAAADPTHAATYQANGDAYAKRLDALAARMRAASREFDRRNIVTFHDAFAYLARDLELNVVATLTVDPEVGLAPPQMAELSRVIREQNVAAVFYEPAYAYSDRVARTLSEQTGVAVFPLNPFNFHDGRPDPDAYERVMGENLAVLQRALGGSS